MTTALKLQSGRQNRIEAYIDIALANVATNVALAVLELPANAVLIDGDLITTQAWNSTTSDVMDVGDAGSATRYLTDGNIRALAARVPLVPTGYVYTAPTRLTVTWTSGGGTPTTGAVTLRVSYYVRGRSLFGQGLDKAY